MPPRKPGFFVNVFSRKRSVKQRKKRQPNVFSSNLKATRKNSGTFETCAPKKVDFPLSIVFDQALQFIWHISIIIVHLECELI